METLFAGPQAEMLPQVAPSSGYLDLLDRLGAHVQPLAHDLVYVSRALLPAAGGGGTAGEIYLETLLRFAGVQVLDPASASIADQMNTYAGARHLVFAEGSALHGRQLLGHLPQRITVLRRRKGRNMARAMLAPALLALSLAPMSASLLVPSGKTVRRALTRALLALLICLRCLPPLPKIGGGDLASGWDNAAFRAAAGRWRMAWIITAVRLARRPPRYLIAAGAGLPGRLPRHTRDLSKG
ncbi:MAG: glycosyltransferase 61 family protein [Cypionkella sp.]|nr:glycosyltransferase 61 family protein [Cypionkella sp.]